MISRDRTIGYVLAIAAGGYLALQLRNGWVPWDEGALAQSAERVLLGEIPHRDFGELYTGGLTFLHAAAFGIFGIDLLVPRLVLLCAFVIWVYLLYRVALHYLPVGIAVPTVALGIAWSVPNYPAAMPSWYNLFFATAGLLAVLQFIDQHDRRWLVVAGSAAGISVGFKIVGLYLAAATAFYLLYDEQTSGEGSQPTGNQLAYRAFLALAVVSGVAGPALLIARSDSAADWFRYVLPVASIGMVLLLAEGSMHRAGSGRRFRSLFSLASPYLIGFSAPLGVLLLYYSVNGATHDLLEGVFVRPVSRIQFADFPAFPIISVAPALMLLAWLTAGSRLARQFRKVPLGVQSGLLIVALFAAYRFPLVFQIVWLSAYHLAPLIVLAGCYWLMRSNPGSAVSRRLFLLLSTTAFVSLTQYPFSGAMYFYYVAPLVILSMAAVIVQIHADLPAARSVALPAVFYLLFAILLLNPASPDTEEAGDDPDRWFVPLALPRADLYVSATDSVRYHRLLEVLDSLGERRIGYAGPDAPEVYFLAEVQNPTRHLFEFLDSKSGTAAHILTTVSDSDVVVLNYAPPFSTQFFASDSGRFEQRFPQAIESGGFTIRWRE